MLTLSLSLFWCSYYQSPCDKPPANQIFLTMLFLQTPWVQGSERGQWGQIFYLQCLGPHLDTWTAQAAWIDGVKILKAGRVSSKMGFYKHTSGSCWEGWGQSQLTLLAGRFQKQSESWRGYMMQLPQTAFIVPGRTLSPEILPLGVLYAVLERPRGLSSPGLAVSVAPALQHPSSGSKAPHLMSLK